MIYISGKKWIAIFTATTFTLLISIALLVIIYDPFFHYHKPLIDVFLYKLENERYQNDGILRHFDYTGIITGTSMTENFMKSEADEMFGENFIKVPFNGGTYKEINDNIIKGIKYNKKLKIIIRGLDYAKFFDRWNLMRTDLGKYPTYLYDDNIFNDVEYVLNIDVLKNSIKRLYKSFIKNEKGIENNFDTYTNWMRGYTFGKNSVFGDKKEYKFDIVKAQCEVSDEEYKIIDDNIEKNVLSVALDNPQISFYYFFTPYSAAWWGERKEKGEINKYISAEKYIIEKLINTPNIYLFSFNDFYDMTTNLNNYKDVRHYGEWINTDMLNYMKNDVGRLTKENYKKYLENEENFYTNFNYNELFNQVDEPDRPLKLEGQY